MAWKFNPTHTVVEHPLCVGLSVGAQWTQSSMRALDQLRACPGGRTQGFRVWGSPGLPEGALSGWGGTSRQAGWGGASGCLSITFSSDVLKVESQA